MVKISVVLLNWNQAQLTIGCLNSILKAKRGQEFSLEIVLVDNNSQADEKEQLRAFLDQARFQKRNRKLDFVLVENKSNLGFAEGNNRGIKQALKDNADFIFILNNDTVIAPDCLMALIEAANNDSRVGIFSPKIYYAPGFEFHQDRYTSQEKGRVIWYAGGQIDWTNILGRHRGVDEVDNGQYDQEEEVLFATGCAFMARREVFEKIGLFDSDFFLYLEDLDFSFRAIRAGFKILFVPGSVIYHKNAASSGGSGSKLQNYYLTRNRLLFAAKHASWRVKVFLLLEAIKIFFGQDRIRRQAVIDFFWGKLGFKDFSNM